jgi:hypothetical protein
MNLTKRQLVIIIIALAVLVLLVLILLSLVKNPQLGEDSNVSKVYDSGQSAEQARILATTAGDPELAGAKLVAKNFVERYYSFSNQNWGENLEILQNLMTEGMQQRSQRDLLAWKIEYPEDEFYGVSSKVVSQKLLTEADDDYTLLVSVQQEETEGDSTAVIYHNYQAELVKAADSWLINSLTLSSDE